MLLCCCGNIKATVLPQETLSDEIYQLYPLGVACRNGDLEVVKQLLSGEEEPMAMGNEYYEFDILYTAIYYNKEDVLRYALTKYKNINDRLYSDEYGLTLLVYSCKLSNLNLSRILLENGIDVNGYQSPDDTYKVYPIMEAIANKNIELVRLLLEHNANLAIKDSNNNCPLSLAREVGAKDIEALLLQWIEQQNDANKQHTA